MDLNVKVIREYTFVGCFTRMVFSEQSEVCFKITQTMLGGKQIVNTHGHAFVPIPLLRLFILSPNISFRSLFSHAFNNKR